MEIPDLLNQYRSEVLPLAEEFFTHYRQKAVQAGQIPEILFDRFVELFPKGKLGRGALTVLGYELAGGKNHQEAVKASLMVEITATAILVADDVFDGDTLRRGQPTIHTVWSKHWPNVSGPKALHYGESIAMTTAFIFWYLSPLALLETGFDWNVKQKVLKLFFESNMDVGFGEALDITTPYYSLKEKKGTAATIHDYKTVGYSAYIPLLIGATLAGNTDTTFLSNLTQYGENLGKIFQIRDDIIGSFGDPNLTGKANTSDIGDARWTILMEILEQAASARDRVTLVRLLQKPSRTGDDIEKIKAMMTTYGAVDKAKTLAEEFLSKGLALIPLIAADNKKQETLQNLLYFMLNRHR